MHTDAYRFVARIVKSHPPAGLRVLEIGSLNVNGSVRALFDGCARYTGIDRHPGREVDIVVDARKYNGRAAFDMVVTTETLEHDPEPETIIACAKRALKPGGMLVITAASTGRAPHNCDGLPWDGIEPYENIAPARLVRLLSGWQDVQVEYNPAGCDVYAVAVKP